MNPRIQRLRRRSLEARPTLSPERARLLTEFYRDGEAGHVSIPVARALAFKFLMEKKTIFIGADELIVGERGPEPKATPTYPEICIHSLRDLEILNQREKISFAVSPETQKIFSEQLIPFWRGRSLRERILADMDPAWKSAYQAGVFTEFMEQRAPGHTVLDDKIYHQGFLDFQAAALNQIAQLDFLNDPQAFNKWEELKAMSIVAEALIIFAHRHAEKATALATQTTDLQRQRELLNIAEICRQVPAHPPRNLWEALQHYWFVHLGVITELNTWDSFNPGRLDQHLFSFYQNDLAQGTFTEEQIKELLQAFWIKFNNQPAPPKVGVTAQESNTYTDFCLINLGGVKADGSDAVNDLTFLLLDVIEEMRLLQPSSMVQISKKNPDRYVKRALKIIKTGFGQPSMFNTDAIIQELLRQGKSVVDARNGGASGCVETGAFGNESYILTGYFNLVKVLEITLNQGRDPRRGETIGLATGDPSQWQTYDDVWQAFTRQLHYFIAIKIKGNQIIERLYAQYLPAPFLSLLINDCLANGKDYNDGGARYNSAYIQGVGLGSITDALAAIKYQVFDQQAMTLSELITALTHNFEGYTELRTKLMTATPKYGNDDPYADAIMRQVFEAYFKAIDGRPTTKGGQYRINLLPTTCHVYFGSVIGATPDGRQAGEPLSEGISPVQGADRNGPTAVIKSAAKMDHLRTGGTLLNQKFTPQFFKDDAALTSLTQLVRTYFKLDGHHIQFNVVHAATLRDAQRNPEKYSDLIVRVAGYSDYFVDLGVDLQNEIINRTEHEDCD